MELDEKYVSFAKNIQKIFQKGLKLNNKILYYIDSTFSNPSAYELEKIISDDSDCEKDALVELIFFPDESIQIQLEDVLEKYDFEKQNEKKIADYLSLQQIETVIYFPDDRGSLKIEMPDSVVSQFISRLNISKKQHKKVFCAVNNYVDKNHKNCVRVKLRNTRFAYTDNKILFLRCFFEKIKSDSNEFIECLDFILDFLDELQDDNDIFQALMDKKILYSQNLQKTEKFEEQIKENNMETLILQGVKIPYINKESTLNKMRIIDKINRAVFSDNIVTMEPY